MADLQFSAGRLCRELGLSDMPDGFARNTIGNALLTADSHARADERTKLERYFASKGEAVNWSGVEIAAAIREGWDESQ